MKKDPIVAKYDLQVSKNNRDHRTIELSKEARLFLRRGQEFTITLKFKDQTIRQAKLDQLSLITKTGPNPSKRNGTKNSFPISSLGDRKTWSARVIDNVQGTWTVSVTSPANAIIGYYSLSIKIPGALVDDLGDFMLLFNPWCKDDPVYLYNEAQRQEYILNEEGIIYLGTESCAQPHPWHFGQFEPEIPDICMKFLDMNPRYQEEPEKHYTRRNDPIYISQMIGDMIGRRDEKDRVDFMCENGRLSYTWISSVPILRLWFQDKNHQTYGHHWVFSAVLCTVLRCLGIPIRIVTNYNSAYGTDQTLQKDIYYNENGARIHRSRNDSIWHFHVWNECWMERKDLLKGYSGWQVLDATAQQKYNGDLYSCGPAPVVAIKEGRVDFNYDMKLIFSKVFTDRVVWVRDTKGYFSKAYSNARHVGDGISTKSIGSDVQNDLTHDYKYPKGSTEEYEAVQRAKQLMLKNQQTSETNPMFLSPIVVSIISQNAQLFGEDISVTVTVSNVCEKEKDLELVLSAQSAHDYGITREQFWSEKFDFHLMAGEERSVSGRISHSMYKMQLLDNNLLRVTALVKEPKCPNGSYALAEKDLTVCKPALTIQMPKVSVQYQPITAMVNFPNPLKETLKKCVIRVTGKGLLYKEKTYRCRDVLPEGNLLYPITFTPTQVGDRRLYVQLQSDKLGVINGFQGLQVLPSDVQEWSVHHWEDFQRYAVGYDSSGQSESDAPLYLSIQSEDIVLYGQDIPIAVRVINHRKTEKKMHGFLFAQYVDENGNGCPHFWRKQFDFCLQAKEDNTFRAQILHLQYAGSPWESSVVRLTVLVKDVTSTHCTSRRLAIHKPKILIKMQEDALQYRPITAIIRVTNSLEEELKSCVLTLSGEGLIHKERTYGCDDIDPGSPGEYSITFSPSQMGVVKLYVRFNCRQFRDVISCHNMEVLPSEITEESHVIRKQPAVTWSSTNTGHISQEIP
ncbi:protein 4.2-like [Mixophyes fleayi]|uniref:protein 4.2-like n=1 Tax=Mixophyes fleayi TaxID=3061075 RepID=UPI003F4DB3C8